MTYVQPCADGQSDPNDWFIGKDGKQYPDDELPGLAEAIQALEVETLEKGRLPTPREYARVEDDVLREQLRKRRHAVDRCHLECYWRTHCLDIALREGHRSGTWGGYTEEQLKELRLEIDRRKKNRNP